MKRTLLTPHQPGVVWIKRGSAWVPKDSIAWNRILSTGELHLVGKDVGLLEVIGSLFCLQTIHKHYPQLKLKWSGREDFAPLVRQQGIAKVQQIEFTATLPHPYFKDLDGNQYLNYTYRSSEFILERIIKTTCLDNEDTFDSTWLEEPKEFIKKHSVKNRLVLIQPEKMKTSNHLNDTLKWTQQQVRAFITLVIQNGFQPLLLCSKASSSAYMTLHHGKILHSDDPMVAVGLMHRYIGIFAADIDILLSGVMMNPEVKVFGIGNVKKISLMRNASSINTMNLLYSKTALDVAWCSERLKDKDERFATNRYWFR